jgi:branched-chain amino acid transport system ATP-binding protein
MLLVKDLTVSYDSVRAVRGIDIEVGAGEIVCLLGPNGAGKSSTLRAISHLIEYRGSIHFDGTEVRSLRPDQLSRRGLIHVPEGRQIFPNLTVDDNLHVGLAASSGRHGGFSLTDVYDMLPALQNLRKRSGWALSGGEQQMLAIGRALVAGPRLMLIDEPSLGLAPRIVSSVFGILKRLRERIPILIVEQNTTMALQIADRAYIMVDGLIELKGKPEELGDRDALIRSYLGQRRLPGAP